MSTIDNPFDTSDLDARLKKALEWEKAAQKNSKDEFENKKAHEDALQYLRKQNELELHTLREANAKELLEWQLTETKDLQKELDKRELQKAKKFNALKVKIYEQEIEKAEKKKKGGKLTPDELKKIKLEVEAKAKAQEAADKKKEAAEKSRQAKDKAKGELKQKGLASLLGKNSEFNKLDGGQKLDVLASALGDFAKQLDGTIEQIAGTRSAIDTRLYGSKNKTREGSYWESLSSTITGVAGVSPLIRQEKYAENIKSLVGQGIAFNVDQRAFLETIKDKIATTFNAADGTLLRLVRIQQQDTTAGRLGMEAALNEFLNNMYETTEYMNSIATSVRSSLEEMESLMGGAAATEVEYQMQKWMGSLYSVGMSQNSVNAIAQAFGQLAAGDISSLQGGGAGNLLVMAANAAGISIADILAKGVDAKDTNDLMTAMVGYLQEIAESSSDSRVVQQQMAKIYGLSASDLKAATNLASSLGVISKNGLTYGGMYNNLNSMMNSMYQRTSIGEMMSNVWSNTKYSMANGIASNPALYAIYKAAGLLDSVAGGIAIPAISAMGTGVDLETTVADLMRVGALSGGILQSIGMMIGSGGNGGITGAGMLRALGMNGSINTVSRGSGGGLSGTGGITTSSSGYVGNSSGSDVYNSTMAGANDTVNSKTVEATESEDTDIKNKVINESVLKIYDLLTEVCTGSRKLHVDIDEQFVWTRTEADGTMTTL